MTERFNGPYTLTLFDDWNCEQDKITFEYENGAIHGSGDPAFVVAVWFVCPCGCKDNTRLPVNGHKNDIGAGWSLSVDDQKRVTLSPSIHAKNSCGAHYFIRSGMVEWA